MFKMVDVRCAIESEPPVLDFIVPGLLKGTIGLLIGAGSSGKSVFALQLAASVAGAGNLLGINTGKQPRKVFYVSLEDPHDIIIRRLNELGKHINPVLREVMFSNLSIGSVENNRLDLMDAEQVKGLIELVKSNDLIIIDTLSRTHTMDENSNNSMAQFVTQLERLASGIGAAVLVIHHIAKMQSETLSHAARGASALTDNVRFVALLSKPTKEDSIAQEHQHRYVKFSYVKNNYSKSGAHIWYERVNEGILIQSENPPTADSSQKRVHKKRTQTEIEKPAEKLRPVAEEDNKEWWK